MIASLTPARIKTVSFFAITPALVLASQVIPHEPSFPEMGALFTLSVYDVALALIGLSLNAAQLPQKLLFLPLTLLFLGTLLPIVMLTEPLLRVLQRLGVDGNLYMLPPAAVILTGVGLWAPERLRGTACFFSAALLGVTLGLFIGLEDLAISSFIAGAVASALWCVVAPSQLVRHIVPVHGQRIADRILGSWLVAIGLIVLLTALLPPRETTPADLTVPATHGRRRK